MNATTNKRESMMYDTSRINSFADITASYDAKTKQITLDLRLLPAIKIDAIAYLYDPRPVAERIDLRIAAMLFVNALYNRYNIAATNLFVEQVWYNDPYEVKMELDWERFQKPFELIEDLKEFLKNEANIVLHVRT